MSSYRPIGCPSPIKPKYIAGPIRFLSKAKFIPHIGKSVFLGMVMTASTNLKSTKTLSTGRNHSNFYFKEQIRQLKSLVILRSTNTSKHSTSKESFQVYFKPGVLL